MGEVDRKGWERVRIAMKGCRKGIRGGGGGLEEGGVRGRGGGEGREKNGKIGRK